jgi:hypothetical protein
MQKLLIKLIELMGIVTGDKVVIESVDNFLWRLDLPLGKLSGGTYDSGYWGDAHIEDTDAWLTFTVGNLHAENEFSIGEGRVNLNYAAGNEGLAYTGELEDVVTARIKDLYNLRADGSEQGMQGDDYISLDIWVDDFDDVEFTGEQMDADFDDSDSENYLKQFCRFENYPGVTNGDLYQAVLAS